MTWTLKYYDTDHWVDITDYIIEMTKFKYSMDNRLQGSQMVLNIVLDESAIYGAGKYKLTLGTGGNEHYFLYQAPPDGIELLADKKVSITLIDFIFYNLDKRDPLPIRGIILGNLISYWKCDTDGSFPDLYGGYDGTIVDASYSIGGKINGCYKFDSDNLEYVTIIGFPNKDIFSISLWFKLKETWDSGSSGTMNIISKDDGTDGFALQFNTADNGKMRFATNHGNIQTVQDSWTGSQWYHIVVTQTGTTGEIWVNGVLDVTGNNGYAGYDNIALYIGKRYNGNYFDGYIDEIGFWDDVLSKREVQHIHNTQKGAIALGSCKVSGSVFRDFKTNYRTRQHSIDINDFETSDDEHFNDWVGSNIHIEDNPRYSSIGMIKGRKRYGLELGQTHINIRDLFREIAMEEGLSLTVDEGDLIETESDDSDDISLSGIKGIWDCKFVNGFIVITYSDTGHFYIRTYDTDGVVKDTVTFESRDWDHTGVGVDNLGYLIYPDYNNQNFYVPIYYCSDYDLANKDAVYDLRIYKYTINPTTGAITQVYMKDFNGESDFLHYQSGDRVIGQNQWTDREQFHSTTGDSIRFRTMPMRMREIKLYVDEDYTYFVLSEDNANPSAGSGYTYIIDLNLENAGGSPWYLKFAVDYTHPAHGWEVDYVFNDFGNNAIIGVVPEYVYNTVTYVRHREFYRVDLAVLDLDHYDGYDTCSEVAEDKHEQFTPPEPIVAWRESINYMYTEDTSREHYYFLPSLPSGVLYTNGVRNNYIRETHDFMDLEFDSYPVGCHYGTSWDSFNDIALSWRDDAWEDPTVLKWRERENYAYKRLYLYQYYAYANRKDQFIDGFVSTGFFYEQRDGSIRLFRHKTSPDSIGTLTSCELFSNKLEGFTKFADKYTIKILGRSMEYGSGPRVDEIPIITGKYGWISPSQVDYYTDWVDKINGTKDGVIAYFDLGKFYEITSTYLPELGKKFVFTDNYRLIEAEVDLLNRTVKLVGVKI